jgi:hypothetical protein
MRWHCSKRSVAYNPIVTAISAHVHYNPTEEEIDGTQTTSIIARGGTFCYGNWCVADQRLRCDVAEPVSRSQHPRPVLQAWHKLDDDPCSLSVSEIQPDISSKETACQRALGVLVYLARVSSPLAFRKSPTLSSDEDSE